jgi:serine protease Do
MLRAWQAHCDERGIILVAPKAANINAWSADETEFVRGVVDHIRSQYSVDPARIAVLGAAEGGKFAWLTAFKHRDLFRGIAIASAPLSQPPPDNDPDFPQQILALSSEGDPQHARIEASVQILQQLKFPAVLLTTPATDVSQEAGAERIALWLDTLDRI